MQVVHELLYKHINPVKERFLFLHVHVIVTSYTCIQGHTHFMSSMTESPSLIFCFQFFTQKRFPIGVACQAQVSG